MSSVVLSTKSQLAIPADDSARAGLEPGQELDLVVEDGIVVLVPVLPIRELRGVLRGTSSDGIREEEDEERG